MMLIPYLIMNPTKGRLHFSGLLSCYEFHVTVTPSPSLLALGVLEMADRISQPAFYQNGKKVVEFISKQSIREGIVIVQQYSFM